MTFVALWIACKLSCEVNVPTKTTPYENQQNVEMKCIWEAGRLTCVIITPGPHLGRHVRILRADRELGAFYAGRAYTIEKYNGHSPHAGLMGDYDHYRRIEKPILPRGDL